MTWMIGFVGFVLIAAYVVVAQIIKPYQALADSLHADKQALAVENRELRAKILAESQRPWLSDPPVDNGHKASVYYMDDEAMVKREREHDDPSA